MAGAAEVTNNRRAIKRVKGEYKMQKIERYLKIMVAFTVIDVIAKIIFIIKDIIFENEKPDCDLEFLDE